MTTNMKKIDRGTKLYAYGANCVEIVVTVEMAVEAEYEQVPGYEAIASIETPAMMDSATARIHISLNPKNNSKPQIKLLGYLSAPYDEEQDESRFYWDALFEKNQFWFRRRTAYNDYLTKQIKDRENEYVTEEALHKSSVVDKIEADIAECKRIKQDTAALIEYARRYGMISKEFLDEERFTQKSDYAFMYIPCYGVHIFSRIRDKETDSRILKYRGVNKFTSDPVVLNCVEVGENGLAIVEFELHPDSQCSHWYTDDVSYNDIGHRMKATRTVRDAVIESVERTILHFRAKLEKANTLHKEKQALKKSIINILKQNKHGLDSVVRDELKD